MSFNPILPKMKLSSKSMLKVLERSLDMVAQDIKVDFEVTVQTWNTKPEFDIKKKQGYRKIFTENDIYRYVSGGTKVRRAVMSPGFRPKSVSGAIRSNVGNGGAVFISKKIALPGIEARRFSEVIKDKWIKELPTIITRAMEVEIRKQIP